MSVAYLVGTQGLVAGTRFAIDKDEIVVGRERGNDITIEDTTVSRRHLRIEKQSQTRIVLFDEGSANGVFVNDVRVKQIRLQDGDVIKVGDNVFLVDRKDAS